jgi:heat shock protein HslJ
MQTNKRAIIVIITCCVIIFTSYGYYKNQTYAELRNRPFIIHHTATLHDTSWTWLRTTRIDGTIVTASSSRFVLTFTREGNRVHSTTDCNSLDSSYIQNGEVLSISSFSNDKNVLCKNSQEATYTEELILATSYSIKSKELMINLNRDAGVMLFVENKPTISTSTN